MPSPLEPTQTDGGYRLGDLEILFGEGGRGKKLRANTLVLAGPRPLVVDASAQERRHKALAGRNPILFFTHYHADHRAAEHCYEQSTETWVSAEDAAAFRKMHEFTRRVDRNADENLRRMIEMIQVIYKLSDREVAREVGAGQWIEAGGCRAQRVPLPGHTPGHSGLFFPEESLFFLTDIDLTPFGPWYGNDASNIEDFQESIARARRVEARWYFTSHGERLLDRERYLEKLDKFEAHFGRRDQMLLDALAGGGKPMEDLLHLGLVYRTHKLKGNESLLYFEKKHVRHHLERLIEAGQVVADESFRRFELA